MAARILGTLAALALATASVAGEAGSGRLLAVGPGKPYALPSAAAAVARNGDTIEIEAGTYRGDVAVWKADELTIRGVNGRAHLVADGNSAQGKAIWVVQGANTTIENIEFSGASVQHRNGAGIRQEGAGLTLRASYFHDNQMGILTGDNAHSDIVIEHCEFAHSRGGSISHNIYIGIVRSFTLRFSSSHHATVGHNVKSRAQTNYLLYNRIMDESDGRSSYAIDLPFGGRSYVIGNLIQQGPLTENKALLAYAAEGAKNAVQEIYVVNNTFVNDHAQGIFLRIFGQPSTARVLNNLFVGPGIVLEGTASASHNITPAEPMFVDRAHYDYRLTQGSPAIDAGTDPGTAAGFPLTPTSQYAHPLAKEARPLAGPLDAGALEFASSARH